MVQQHDPEAFMVVAETLEVMGKGIGSQPTGDCVRRPISALRFIPRSLRRDKYASLGGDSRALNLAFGRTRFILRRKVNFVPLSDSSRARCGVR
jgi:hypothetical protein